VELGLKNNKEKKLGRRFNELYINLEKEDFTRIQQIDVVGDENYRAM
jgi:hypothetical protein